MDFADGVLFAPAAGGTADFAGGTADPGFKPITELVDGGIYSYRAMSGDRTQWEEGKGAFDAADGGSLARTTISASSTGGTKVDFSTPPKVYITPLAGDLVAMLDRSNHTGEQAISTITGLQDAIDDAIDALIGGAPGALDTLNELAAAINDDAAFSATIVASLALKAPLANPTFTGTVAGVTKSHVGLGNVDNTSDANKPVSTAQQTALDGKSDTSHNHAGVYEPVDTDIVRGDVEGQAVSGGVNIAAKNLGNLSGTTKTVDASDCAHQKITNNGAGVISPDATKYSNCVVDLVNVSGAGGVTFTGWTHVIGATKLTTTSGHKFKLSISISAEGSLVSVTAMQ